MKDREAEQNVWLYKNYHLDCNRDSYNHFEQKDLGVDNQQAKERKKMEKK